MIIDTVLTKSSKIIISLYSLDGFWLSSNGPSGGWSIPWTEMVLSFTD